MTFKIYHKLLGGHVHMKFFVNGGKAGDLCMRDNEFATFKSAASFIQFWDEDQKKPMTLTEDVFWCPTP